MTDATVIATRGLGKDYGDVHAVAGLSLDVRRGEVYGFLGRNGAGKTTTIRMLLGLIRPTAGEVFLLGEPLASGAPRVFGKVGYLVETAASYPNLTVRENLEIQRRLTGSSTSALAGTMATMRLTDYADRLAGELSLGNKQRLSLARALLHDPEVLLLDEPANALDPAGIVEIRELLRGLARDRGVTVFMSSHILAEVAHLADRIGIIHEGRLLQELDYDEVQRRSRAYLEVVASDPDRARALLAERLGIGEATRDGDALRLQVAEERAPEIARVLVEAGLDLRTLAVRQEDLESYFLRLTGGTP